MNPAEGTTPQAPSSEASPFSAALEKILANPQLLSTVASALKEADATPPSESASPMPSDALSQKLPQMMAAMAPMLTKLSQSDDAQSNKGQPPVSAPSDPRACLLCALKPYLSDSRREAIDYMIRLGKLSDLLRNLS